MKNLGNAAPIAGTDTTSEQQATSGEPGERAKAPYYNKLLKRLQVRSNVRAGLCGDEWIGTHN